MRKYLYSRRHVYAKMELALPIKRWILGLALEANQKTISLYLDFQSNPSGCYRAICKIASWTCLMDEHGHY